jgi:hypothetical protein
LTKRGAAASSRASASTAPPACSLGDVLRSIELQHEDDSRWDGEWDEAWDEAFGRRYYFNTRTGHVQWARP